MGYGQVGSLGQAVRLSSLFFSSFVLVVVLVFVLEKRLKSPENEYDLKPKGKLPFFHHSNIPLFHPSNIPFFRLISYFKYIQLY